MAIKLKLVNDQMIATVNEEREVKVAYSMQFNTVSVIRKSDVLRTDVVPENYTLRAFMEYCVKTKQAFQLN